MAEKTGIEWADSTWNPLVGCTKVSPGCDHCYAETLVNRFAGHNAGFPNTFDIVTERPHMLGLPLTRKWADPRRVFVNSLSDLFHADVADAYIADVFAVMAAAPQHSFQLLTKRHGRMRSLLSSSDFAREVVERRQRLTLTSRPGKPLPDWEPTWPLPNVWLGVSVEDQTWADIRIPALLATPAAVRWISAEPLLGPVDLRHWITCSRCLGAHVFGTCEHLDGAALRAQRHGNSRNRRPGLDWVVVGGESGKGARPMHPQWVRDLRDQCAAADVAFLFKQWGEWLPLNDRPGSDEVEYVRPGKKAAGRELDGRTYDGYPA